MANYNELGASALAQYVGHRPNNPTTSSSAITRDANTKNYPIRAASSTNRLTDEHHIEEIP